MKKSLFLALVLAIFSFTHQERVKVLLGTGIDFHEFYAKSFKVRTGAQITTFRPGKITVGYYFIAPGKKPRIEYGVINDLADVATEYFGKVGK